MQSTLESISSVAANAFLSAVFLVGTGGFATPRTINYVPSGMLNGRVLRGSVANIDSDRLLDTQEKLAGIRRYLSMNVTDMAKVLRVGRPTVYSWLRDEPSLRAEHARRIEVIYRIARKWRLTSSRPVGAFLSRQSVSGGTLLTLLSAKTLDEPAIQGAFSQIADALSRAARRPGVVEVAKRRGFKLAPSQQPTNWSSGEDVDM